MKHKDQPLSNIPIRNSKIEGIPILRGVQQIDSLGTDYHSTFCLGPALWDEGNAPAHERRIKLAEEVKPQLQRTQPDQ